MRDEVDRAHVAIGFAVAVPALILEAHCELFASRWVWRGLTPEESAAAVDVLLALQPEDHEGVKRTVTGLGAEGGGRTAQALFVLELLLPPTPEEGLRLAPDAARSWARPPDRSQPRILF